MDLGRKLIRRRTALPDSRFFAAQHVVLRFSGPEINPPTRSPGPPFFRPPARCAAFSGSGNQSADPLSRTSFFSAPCTVCCVGGVRKSIRRPALPGTLFFGPPHGVLRFRGPEINPTTRSPGPPFFGPPHGVLRFPGPEINPPTSLAQSLFLSKPARHAAFSGSGN